MQKVYESNFQYSYFDKEKSLLIHRWKPASKKLSEEECKTELLQQIVLVETFQPRITLADATNFFFTISIELQEWVDDELIPRAINAGLQKMAFVMSKEFVAQLSVEQTLNEKNAKEFMSAFFATEEEALEWLCDFPSPSDAKS
ncbi:hypothetical protein [Flexithrix dorotheae]|uniref:hypothetical protein n=1 Tax=Flexithrix dorotheae TaxID=70993 RepID=UPI00036B4824|nr:hypothetical protein [Flexithrix dorotheae]